MTAPGKPSHPAPSAAQKLGYGFVKAPYLPCGQDEQYLRFAQSPRPADSFRRLKAGEVRALIEQGNTAGKWDDVLVTDPFLPACIRGCEFHGLVRIGRLTDGLLEVDQLRVPIGLYRSRIISCDIGRQRGRP